MKEVFRDTIQAYAQHQGPMISAALAFYVLLSAAPLGVFLVAIVGGIYGRTQAREQLTLRLAETLGPSIAGDISQVLERAGQASTTAFATFVGFVLFFIATTRVVETLRDGLNHTWGVVPVIPAGLRGAGLAVLERRLAAGAVVIFCGLVFALFTVLRTAVDLIADRLQEVPFVFRIVEHLLGWAAITLVTGVVFKRLPDARIAWQDAMVGAAVTGLLAVVGALLAGRYASQIAVEGPYGAAGSIVAFLLFVYYCSQVFFFGAEFTAAYARHRGEGVHPLPHARKSFALEDPTGSLPPPPAV